MSVFAVLLGKNSPGTMSGAPKTISAGETLRPSFGVDGKPRRTHDNCGNHDESLHLDIRAAFRVLWKRSTIPFASGLLVVIWWTVVLISFPKDVHSWEVKVVPRSDAMCSGMLNLEIHPESRAAVQEAKWR